MENYELTELKISRCLFRKKNITLDSNIYRIMPIDRFIQVITEEKFPLFRPRIWDDPFENLLLNSKFSIFNSSVCVKEIRDSFYGVCWSLTKENDAMWRIYSPDKRGVKIKTKISKVFDAIFYDLEDKEKISFSVGDVVYLADKEIVAIFSSFNENNITLADNNSSFPSSLLFKRPEFKHENEIRFLIEKKGLSEDICKLNFNWFDCIEEIVFDPRIDKDVYESYKTLLINHYKFKERIIKKSELYTKPIELNIQL